MSDILENKFDFIDVPASLNINFGGFYISRDDRYAVQINAFLGGLTNYLINPSIFAHFLNFNYENGINGFSVSKSVVVREGIYNDGEPKNGLVCEFYYGGKRNVLTVDENGVPKLFNYTMQTDNNFLKICDFEVCDNVSNPRVQFLVSYLSQVYSETLEVRKNNSRG